MSGLQGMYQELILDHARHPQHAGRLEAADAEAHHVNPTCGDEVTVQVRVRDDGAGPVVAAVAHDGQGCSISRASASVMSGLVLDRPVPDALAAADAFLALVSSRGAVEPDEEVLGDGVAFAGVARYPARVKCALLAWMAWKDAVARAVEGQDSTARTLEHQEETR